jgi:hypothetical protein
VHRGEAQSPAVGTAAKAALLRHPRVSHASRMRSHTCKSRTAGCPHRQQAGRTAAAECHGAHSVRRRGRQQRPSVLSGPTTQCALCMSAYWKALAARAASAGWEEDWQCAASTHSGRHTDCGSDTRLPAAETGASSAMTREVPCRGVDGPTSRTRLSPDRTLPTRMESDGWTVSSAYEAGPSVYTV